MFFINKFIAGLILGVATGAAAAVLLQTEKGKEILSNLQKTADDVSETVKKNWKHVEEDLSEMLKKGKQFVDDLDSKVKDAAV